MITLVCTSGAPVATRRSFLEVAVPGWTVTVVDDVVRASYSAFGVTGVLTWTAEGLVGALDANGRRCALWRVKPEWSGAPPHRGAPWNPLSPYQIRYVLRQQAGAILARNLAADRHGRCTRSGDDLEDWWRRVIGQVGRGDG